MKNKKPKRKGKTKPVKVRRQSVHAVFKDKPALRIWLDEQPRKKLRYLKSRPAYKQGVHQLEGTGWKLEDFIRECWHRGVEVRISTVNKWLQGHYPRTFETILRKEFPTIKF